MTVQADPVRGHITITGQDGRAVTFCDLGPVLNLWSFQGTELTPDDATQLAHALTDWATKKTAP